MGWEQTSGRYERKTTEHGTCATASEKSLSLHGEPSSGGRDERGDGKMKHNDQDTMARMRREVDVGKGACALIWHRGHRTTTRGETTLCNRTGKRPSRNPGVGRS